MRNTGKTTTVAVLMSALLVLDVPAAPKTGAGNENQIGHVERVSKLLGREIRNGGGESLGNLDNVVVDLESGRLLLGVIKLKDGSRVAVPPAKFAYSGNNLIARVTTDNLQNAPKFERNQVANTSYATDVYQHFNQPMWWEGGDSGKGTFGNSHRATELMGNQVKDVSNKNYGNIKDMVVDVPAGRVLYVAFSPSGNSGNVSQVYLMPPNAFTMNPDDKTIVTGVEKDKLKDGPHFGSGNWPSNLENSSYASRVYNYYGKEPYFK